MAGIIDPKELEFFSEFDRVINKLTMDLEKLTGEFEQLQSASGGKNTQAIKALREEIKNTSGSIGELSKNLASYEGKVTAITTGNTKATGVYGGLEKSLLKTKRELEKLRKEADKVKTSQEGASKSAGGMNSVYAGLAQRLFGLTAGIAILRKGFNTLKEQIAAAYRATVDFEVAIKQVGAITRASDAELVALTANANKLGASTEYTSIQIARLQKELGKLGFTPTEIINTTAAVVDLATATGEDLVESGKIAAATLRVFNMDVTESGRVVDVMAGSFVRSGLDLEKFRESVKLLGPIANAANIDLETTTAMLSRLADAGLSGSLAGTSLRNVISRLADPNSKLAKYLGHTVTNSEELIEAFKTMRDEGIGLAEVVELVDIRARPAFLTLLQQIDGVESLSEEYKLLHGEANRLADTMRDTLANDVEILNSAFDATRRELFENFIPALRSSAQGLTEFTEAIRFWLKDTMNFNEVIGVLGDKLTRLLGLSKDMGKFELRLVQEKQIELTQQLGSTLEGIRGNVELMSDETQGMVDRAKELQDIRRKEKTLTEEQRKELDLIAKALQAQFGDHVAILDGERERFIMTELIGKNIEKAAKDTETNLLSLSQQKKELAIQIAQQEEKIENYVAEYNWLDKIGKAMNLDRFDIEAQNTELDGMNERFGMINAELEAMKEFWDKIVKATQKKDEGDKKVLSNSKNFMEIEKQRSQFEIEHLNTLIKKADLSAQEQTKLARALAEEKKYLSDLTYRMEMGNIEKATKSEADKGIERTLAYEKMVNDKEKAERDFTIFLTVEQEKRFKKQQEKMDNLYGLRQKSLHRETALVAAETAEMNRLMVIQDQTSIDESNRNLALLHDYQIMARREQYKKIIAMERQQNQQSHEMELARIEVARASNKRVLKESSEYKAATLATQEDLLNKVDALYDAMGKTSEATLAQMNQDTEFTFKEMMASLNMTTMEMLAEIGEALAPIADEMFARAKAKMDQQLDDLKAWEEERTKLAGDNEDAKERIAREAELKRRQLLQRQAIMERKQALFQIKLSTAIGVARALASAEPPRNWIQAGITAAKGAIEYALVATRPIPAFEKGTDSSPAGKALVSEKGQELVREKSGKTWLTPSSPSIVDLKAGSQIIPHDRTKEILDRMSMSDDNSVVLDRIMRNTQVEQRRQDSKDTDRIVTAIMDMPKDSISITEHGIERFVQRKGLTKRVLNKRYGFKR